MQTSPQAPHCASIDMPGESPSPFETADAERRRFSAAGFNQRVAEKRVANSGRGFLLCTVKGAPERPDTRVATQVCVCGDVLAVLSERSASTGPRQQSLCVMSLRDTELSMVVWPKRNTADERLIAVASVLPEAMCEEPSKRFLLDRNVPEQAITCSVHVNIGYTTGALIDGHDVFLVRYAHEGSSDDLRQRFVAIQTSSLCYSRPGTAAGRGIEARAQMRTCWLTGVCAPRVRFGIVAAGYCNASRRYEIQVWKSGADGADALAQTQLNNVCAREDDKLLEVASDRLQHVVVFVERAEEWQGAPKQMRITLVDFGAVDSGSSLRTFLNPMNNETLFCGASVCGTEVAMALRDRTSGFARVRIVSLETPAVMRVLYDIDMMSQIPRCVCMHGGMVVISSLLDNFEIVSMCHTRSNDAVTLYKQEVSRSSLRETALLCVDTFYVAHSVVSEHSGGVEHAIHVHSHPMVPISGWGGRVVRGTGCVSAQAHPFGGAR
jgi:hypothetical protein